MADEQMTPEPARKEVAFEVKKDDWPELAPEDEAIRPMPHSPGEIHRLNLMLRVNTEWQPRPSTSPAGVVLPPLPTKPNPSRKIHMPSDCAALPEIPEFYCHTFVGECRKCELLRKRAVGESRPQNSPDNVLRLVHGPFDTSILLPRSAPLSRSSSVPAICDSAWECWRQRQQAAEKEADRLVGAIERLRNEDWESRNVTRQIFDTKGTTFGYAARKDLTAEEHAAKLKAMNEAKER